MKSNLLEVLEEDTQKFQNVKYACVSYHDSLVSFLIM
jgi:hypothetical protein